MGWDETCAPGSSATPGRGRSHLDSYVARPWKAAARFHIRQDLPQSSTRLHTVAETPGCAASVGHSTTAYTVSTREHITTLKCLHLGNRKRTHLHGASHLGASTQAPWCEASAGSDPRSNKDTVGPSGTLLSTCTRGKVLLLSTGVYGTSTCVKQALCSLKKTAFSNANASTEHFAVPQG